MTAFSLKENAVMAITRLLAEGRPIIAAWSGGKDSSVVLNLLLTAAMELRAAGRNVPQILITHSDTRIENPEVASYVIDELRKVERFARHHDISVNIAVASPALNDLWAVRVIGGRGLPTFANSGSRDCTMDFKVKPMQRLRKAAMKSFAADGGKPITLLGTRYEESTGRAARMASRGESDVDIREDENGWHYLSPIAYWDTSDVWEYLAAAKSGQIPSYSDFEETFRIYAAAGASSCAVVSDMNTESLKKSRACGARTGCAVCVAVNTDKSLQSMIESEERYHYMRGLNQLQQFLVATQFDYDRRQWLGRSIDEDGYISVRPNAYSPGMMEELLKYSLTLDAQEQEEATRLGIEPRFKLVPPDALVLIDAQWSLSGAHRPFHALKIYRDVFQYGHRYDIPAMEPGKPSSPPAAKKMYVGKDWNDREDLVFAGLRDPLLEAFEEHGCCEIRILANGCTVLDMPTDDYLSVNEEGVYFILEYELDRLIREYHDNESYPRTQGYRWYANLGVISVTKRQIGVVDTILRRTTHLEKLGLVGQMDKNQLLSMCEAKPELDRYTQQKIAF